MSQDYSAHLIAARKALATAEAHAALHKWDEASNAVVKAVDHCYRMQDAMINQSIHERSLYNAARSGADKL